jgi:hypothetical protein
MDNGAMLPLASPITAVTQPPLRAAINPATIIPAVAPAIDHNIICFKISLHLLYYHT